MATRLYPTTVDSGATPTRRGSWNVAIAASAANYSLGDKYGSAAGPAAYKTTTGASGASARTNNPSTYLATVHTAPAFLSSGTLDGTFTYCFVAYESNAALNAYMQFHIWVMAPNGSLRGTVLDNTALTPEVNSAAIASLSQTYTLSPVAVQAGDRVVVEMGFHFSVGSVSTSYFAQYLFGGTGATDMTSGATDYTNRPGWVEFSGADALFVPSAAPAGFSMFAGALA